VSSSNSHSLELIAGNPRDDFPNGGLREGVATCAWFFLAGGLSCCTAPVSPNVIDCMERVKALKIMKIMRFV